MGQIEKTTMKNFTEKLQHYMSLNYPSQITKIDEADGGGFLIEVPMLKGCMSNGENVEEAYNNLEEAKKEWFTYMLENNLAIPEPADASYSGRFMVRIPKTLHKIITEQSKREGLSLNQYVSNVLAYAAGQRAALTAKKN